ncbi:MAG: sister chromatid cohesion acetyltransferase Eco1 [Amphiamblys sp. WSBS2006]|nr:MAG: sister chromatid cohesion acetyltransferase Eco1 [Amphiamblys sp. WSBS2006]
MEEKKPLRTYSKKAQPSRKNIPLSIVKDFPPRIEDYLTRKRRAAEDRIAIEDQRKVFKETRMKQLHLNTERNCINGIKTCGECGMKYNCLMAQDLMLHKRFHSYLTRGFGIKSWKAADALRFAPARKRDASRNVFLCVSQKTNSALFKKTLELLSLVNTELGAVSFTPEVLGRTKLFVCVKDGEACGLVAAEPVSLFECFFNDDRERADTDFVTVGINRVWVCVKHRRKGVATDLVDCARCFFFPEGEVERRYVAMSQMTRDGSCFARAYFHTEHVLVYANNAWRNTTE